MAVNSPGIGAGTPAPAAPTPAPQQQAAPQVTQQAYIPPASNTPLMSSMLERNLPPLSEAPDAEAMKAFTESIKTLSGAILDQYDVQIVPLNKSENTDLFVSAIILTVAARGNTSTRSYHAMLVADTADQLPVQVQQIQNQPVEIQYVVGDANDANYKAAVLSVLRRAFPNLHPDRLLETEAEVIPRGYDFKDPALVRRTLANGLKAAGTILNVNEPNFQDFTLATRGAELNSVARLLFNQPTASNDVGEPVRTDVVIEFSEVRQQARQQQSDGRISLNSGERSKLALAIGGFMDLMWDPQYSQQQFNPYNQVPQQPQQGSQYLYTPRLVITRVQAPLLNTLPGLLFGLATTLTLRENNNWMGAWPRPSGDGFDPKDIGAIGIEANLEKNPSGFGTRIDTRKESFTPSQQGMLIGTFVRPELAISMDVSETGPETWLTSQFLAIARGSQEAVNDVIGAADLLTNGIFSRLYPSRDIVLNDNNRIHLGWYVDKDGQRRDIRDVDHLCVLNMIGETDPQAAQDYSETFTNRNYSLELRLDRRKRLLETLIRSKIEMTGFAYRVTFVGAFLEALAQAALQSGVVIRTQTPYQDPAGQPRTGADWLAQGRLAQSSTGLFNRNVGPGAVGGPNLGTSFGRWHR